VKQSSKGKTTTAAATMRGKGTMKTFDLIKTVIVVAFGTTLITSQAKGDITFNLGTSFNGTQPSGSAPWLTADFKTVAPNTVTLTLTTDLKSPSEFITQFAFNIAPSYVPAAVTAGTGGSPIGTSVDHTTDNAQTSPGFGGWKGWDFVVHFPTAKANRFYGGTAVITLTAPGLIAEDFNYFNSETKGGGQPLFVGAKVQDIPPSLGGTSGAIGTPVPETTTMFAGAVALGLLLLGAGLHSKRSGVIRIGK
jgi:hypothetical protein